MTTNSEAQMKMRKGDTVQMRAVQTP